MRQRAGRHCNLRHHDLGSVEGYFVDSNGVSHGFADVAGNCSTFDGRYSDTKDRPGLYRKGTEMLHREHPARDRCPLRNAASVVGS